jgi:hypothetical protein
MRLAFKDKVKCVSLSRCQTSVAMGKQLPVLQQIKASAQAGAFLILKKSTKFVYK